MNSFVYTKIFKKDFKRLKRRTYAFEELENVLKSLSETGTVPDKYEPKTMSGKYLDCNECFINPDWILMWIKYERSQEIILVRTGTYADLY